LGILSIVLAVLAFGFAFLVYMTRSISLEWFRAQFAPLVRIVENKYYIDEMYQWTVDRVVLVFSAFIALFDRVVVNDVGVNGPANTVRRLGVTLRLHITGHVYSYALAMVLGAIGLAIFWWLRST
jgi:NADH-quinone oxidoreductase subunit L